jgi:hypothetical protein
MHNLKPRHHLRCYLLRSFLADRAGALRFLDATLQLEYKNVSSLVLHLGTRHDVVWTVAELEVEDEATYL